MKNFNRWLEVGSAVTGVSALLALGGCMAEAQHIHQTTLPDGKPGYVIVCNSQRYDRCLNRAARVCNGAYTIVPQARDTVRLGDPVAGIGNSETIVVSCGK
jgi:hypothetical protein